MAESGGKNRTSWSCNPLLVGYEAQLSPAPYEVFLQGDPLSVSLALQAGSGQEWEDVVHAPCKVAGGSPALWEVVVVGCAVEALQLQTRQERVKQEKKCRTKYQRTKLHLAPAFSAAWENSTSMKRAMRIN